MGPHLSPSPGARARGLGSARRGSEAWLAERISAVALIPLTLWLVISFVTLHGGTYSDFAGWIRKPGSTLLMVLSLLALFHHTALGLEVIIEDYVHSAAKLPILMGSRFLCVALCATGLLAILMLDTKATASATVERVQKSPVDCGRRDRGHYIGAAATAEDQRSRCHKLIFPQRS